MSYTEFYEHAVAVDPPGCGCNECSAGEYVPAERLLEYGSDELLTRVVNGELRNNLGSEQDMHELREKIGPRVGIEVPAIEFFYARIIKAVRSDYIDPSEVTVAEFVESGELGDLQRLIDGEIEVEEGLDSEEIIETMRTRLGIYI